MEPQAGFPIHQILHVQQELIHRFFHIFRTIQQFANFRQRQHGHHQRVIPHLLMVFLRQRDVLHAAVFGARHLIHRPFRPAVEPWQVRRITRLFIAIGQRQERRHGVDVFGGRPLGKTVCKPAVDNIAHRHIAGLLVVLINTVQPYAMRPFPACPSFGINDATIVQAQQKLAGFILDIHQIVRHRLNQGFQLFPGDKALRLS